MASTTTLNAWSEQLVRSLLPDQTSPLKLRKHFERFSRSLKHHNYARTNQFEVQEKLSGLEEKFQVLNHEDISDALHERRLEILQHQYRWIPDVLDLFLHLSNDPVRHTRLERLTHLDEQVAVPTILRWAEIEADDPIDRRSRIWRQPTYSDLSSDEDELLQSSNVTALTSQKPEKVAEKTNGMPKSALHSVQTVTDTKSASQFNARLFWKHEARDVPISEAQIVREVLFMIQGLPTALFKHLNGQIIPNVQFKLDHLSPTGLESVLLSAAEIAGAAKTTRNWSCAHERIPFMQVLEDQIKDVLEDFHHVLYDLHSRHLRTTREGGVVSLLRTIEELRRSSHALVAVERFVNDVRDSDAIGHLDVLFDHLCRLELIGDSISSSALMKVFKQAFQSYCQQLDLWILEGTVSDPSHYFFVQRAAEYYDKARLWHSWYTCTNSGPNRPPHFLQSLIERIFVSGKTVAFMGALGHSISRSHEDSKLSSILDSATSSAATLTPFASTLASSLDQYLTSQLQSSLANLQSLLQLTCNFTSTPTALTHLYLASSPLATDAIDARVFSHLDQCLSNWNDRFLISDLLAETHTDTSLDVDRVIVHSEPTPATILPIVRRSVQVLTNIAFDYLLPWPIANIILPETLASYRRVSLLLTQIRRAKYVLERRAYLRLRNISASNPNSPMTRHALTLYPTLLIFTTTLYSHLTSCVIDPLTRHLHAAMSSTTASWTIDDLITLHQTYLRQLEFACLTSKSLKVLKDAVITLLDICVEFGFSLTDVAGDRSSKNVAATDDRDVGEEGILEKKTAKMKTHFNKHLDFLIAGLRGTARSSAAAISANEAGGDMRRGAAGTASGQGEMMELLADSLESARVRKRK